MTNQEFVIYSIDQFSDLKNLNVILLITYHNSHLLRSMTWSFCFIWGSIWKPEWDDHFLNGTPKYYKLTQHFMTWINGNKCSKQPKILVLTVLTTTILWSNENKRTEPCIKIMTNYILKHRNEYILCNVELQLISSKIKKEKILLNRPCENPI